MQVAFGIFNLERSRLLDWGGQSLYRQTQQQSVGAHGNIKVQTDRPCGSDTLCSTCVCEKSFVIIGLRTYAALTTAGVQPGRGLPSEDGDTTTNWVAVVRLCKNKKGHKKTKLTDWNMFRTSGLLRRTCGVISVEKHTCQVVSLRGTGKRAALFFTCLATGQSGLWSYQPGRTFHQLWQKIKPTLNHTHLPGYELPWVYVNKPTTRGQCCYIPIQSFLFQCSL